MSEPDQPPTLDRLVEILEEADPEEVAAYLDRLDAADAETRKRALRAVRDGLPERLRTIEELAEPLSRFLTDDDRAVRLTTAKLFVALARSEPTVVRTAVDALADRLSDDEEFYYVRARCAEALGYVAVDAPDDVADPDTLADLRVGLAFDESEVKEKLAKALAYIALGDPSRLRHQVSSLGDHLDDGSELVRYHLCTALAAVGCDHPTALAPAVDPLAARLNDPNPYVRGRATEALGLIVAFETDVGAGVDPDEADLGNDPPDFLTERLAFYRRQLTSDEPTDATAGIGTVESIRNDTDDVVDAMTAPEEGACPHCGLELPENDPPMCPQCGSPR